jgi:hypothetical protein
VKSIRVKLDAFDRYALDDEDDIFLTPVEMAIAWAAMGDQMQYNHPEEYALWQYGDEEPMRKYKEENPR